MLSFLRFRARSIGAAALATLALLALPSAGQAQPTPINVVVVNLDAVVARSAGGQELGRKLEAFQQQVQAQGEAKAALARDIRKQITDGVNSLSESKLADLQKQYEDAQIDLKRFQDDKQREGQKMQEEGLREIEKQLAPAIEALRTEEGYDLILNYVPGVVVLAGDRIDITQKVIDRLAAAGN